MRVTTKVRRRSWVAAAEIMLFDLVEDEDMAPAAKDVEFFRVRRARESSANSGSAAHGTFLKRFQARAFPREGLSYLSMACVEYERHPAVF